MAVDFMDFMAVDSTTASAEQGSASD